MKKKKKNSVTIRTPEELIALIKAKHLTPEQTVIVLREALGVWTYPEDVENLIEATEKYIKRWWNVPMKDRPFFLLQETEEFDLKIFYDPEI
jgi:hypothetical protein